MALKDLDLNQQRLALETTRNQFVNAQTQAAIDALRSETSQKAEAYQYGVTQRPLEEALRQEVLAGQKNITLKESAQAQEAQTSADYAPAKEEDLLAQMEANASANQAQAAGLRGQEARSQTAFTLALPSAEAKAASDQKAAVAAGLLQDSQTARIQMATRSRDIATQDIYNQVLRGNENDPIANRDFMLATRPVEEQFQSDVAMALRPVETMAAQTKQMVDIATLAENTPKEKINGLIEYVKAMDQDLGNRLEKTVPLLQGLARESTTPERLNNIMGAMRSADPETFAQIMTAETMAQILGPGGLERFIQSSAPPPGLLMMKGGAEMWKAWKESLGGSGILDDARIRQAIYSMSTGGTVPPKAGAPAPTVPSPVSETTSINTKAAKEGEAFSQLTDQLSQAGLVAPGKGLIEDFKSAWASTHGETAKTLQDMGPKDWQRYLDSLPDPTTKAVAPFRAAATELNDLYFRGGKSNEDRLVIGELLNLMVRQNPAATSVADYFDPAALQAFIAKHGDYLNAHQQLKKQILQPLNKYGLAGLVFQSGRSTDEKIQQNLTPSGGGKK
jgi:hypothetical protein